MTANVLSAAMEKVARAQRDADTLASIAPHVIGEPRQFYPSTGFKDRATLCYKIRTPQELRELVAHYPPVASIAYRGSCAGVSPADCVTERDAPADKQTACDGLTFRVEAGACVGKYPCDEDALGAVWYAETPAGRVALRVDFHFSGIPGWPVMVPRYEYRWNHHTHTNDRVLVGQALQCGFDCGAMRYQDSATLYFSDADHRNAFIDWLEGCAP